MSVHMYVCVYIKHICCMCIFVWTLACVWRSDDNLQEFFLSFHHVGLRDQIQVNRLGMSWLLGWAEPSHWPIFGVLM